MNIKLSFPKLTAIAVRLNRGLISPVNLSKGLLCFHSFHSLLGIKHFEGLHRFEDAPYVGYGHQLLPCEHFTAAITERQADSLLRADLMKCLMMFKDYGKDALLLAVLSYNVGAGRLLGYGKHPKSRLLRKIESGDRNFY